MKTDMELRQERDAHRKAARQVSKLLRQRSRKARGLPAKKSGSYVRKGHEYLEGSYAHFSRRIEIYRNAGGEISAVDGFVIEDLKTGMCQGCAETHEVGWAEGEWHHNVKTLGGRRCDCAACALWVCADWHKRYHNRVIRSGKVGSLSYEDAIEQLENLSDQQGLSGADLLALRMAIDALKEKVKGQP